MKCNDWNCPFNKEGKCTWNNTEKDQPCMEETWEEIFKKLKKES